MQNCSQNLGIFSYIDYAENHLAPTEVYDPNWLDCRIPGHKMANLKHCYRGAAVVYLKHCYRGAAVVLSRCARSPVIVKPGYKIAILKHCYRSSVVMLLP